MKGNKLRKFIMVMSIFLVALAGVGIVYSVAQVDRVTIVGIDYDELTLTVKGNKDDSKIFFANKKNASTWDEIPGELDGNKQINMDISWISASSDYTLYLKGDKTKEPLKVVIPKQNKKFNAKLNTLENKFTFTNKGSATDIYWRKSTSTEWTKYDEDEMTGLLERFSLKGISLVFRTGQVKGTSATNVGERPSKIYTVKIAKRAGAPSVSLDYKTMTFAVKKTMEYKLSTEGSDKWTDITATSLNLDTILPYVMYDKYQELVEAGTIEDGDKISVDFRTKATSKKVASQIFTLEVPGQKQTQKDNIVFGYTGSKQCEIKIKELELDDENVLEAASPTNVYEYTVVEEGEKLDIHEAEWKSITSDTVKISSKIAPENSTIYVRKQGTGKDLPTKEVVLVEKVQYLTASSLNKEVNFKKIQGVQKDLTFDIVVSSMEAKISSITFNGVEAGFKASEPVEMALPDSDSKYVITVTINDTKEIEKISDNIATNMKATITMNNTEIITKGVSLYIQKAATLEAKSCVKYRGMDFYNSDTEEADISFDIALNKNNEAEDDTKISGITYNGRDLAFRDVKKDDVITVTIKEEQLKELDGYVEQRNYGKEINVVVKLSNGEELTGIKVKIVSPVTISGETSSYGVSISSYNDYMERYTQAIEANKNSQTGVSVEIPTDYQDPVITYTLNKDILNRDNTYQFVSLTWNGESVLKQEISKNGAYTVTVSLKQLTALGKTGSANLVLTLENAEKERLIVDYGYQITVTN